MLCSVVMVIVRFSWARGVHLQTQPARILHRLFSFRKNHSTHVNRSWRI